jgi:hypothetical protein
MASGEKEPFLITGGLVRQEGESDKEFAQRRHKAIQQHYGRMSEEERLHAALNDGGLVRLEGESEEDFIRLSHQFVVRGFGSPLSLSQWEHNIRVTMEAAVNSFEFDQRKGRAERVKRELSVSVNDGEYKYLIGDLLEEYAQIRPLIKARIWLFKQVVKSAIPLIYRALKKRLAYYFGGRLR